LPFYLLDWPLNRSDECRWISRRDQRRWWGTGFHSRSLHQPDRTKHLSRVHSCGEWSQGENRRAPPVGVV